MSGRSAEEGASVPALLAVPYRVLLALYPAEFRRQAGPELLRALRRRWAEVRSERGWRGTLGFALSELADLARNLAREWRSPTRPPGPGREQGPAVLLDGLRQDLRFATRSLSRDPLFALLVVAVAALGIGANVTVYGLVDGVLLEPFDYPQPDRLVYLNESYRRTQTKSVAFPNYLDWRQRNRTFEDLGVRTWWSMNLSGRGDARQLSTQLATPNLFEVLGVQPVLGRVYSEAEAEGGERVALVSHGFWRSTLGGRADALGETLMLDGEPYTVVGVMPPELEFPLGGAEIWVPVRTAMSERDLTARGSHPGLAAIGRLAPGASVDAARRDLDRIASELAAEFPETNTEAGVRLHELQQVQVGSSATTIWVLQGAVFLVLLAVCANVASLMLARATRRGGEMSVRAALGAGGARLARQLLVEGWLLAGAAGAAGLGVAAACLVAIRAFRPADLPRLEQVGIDGTVLLFTLAAVALAGLIFALAPALRLRRVDGAASLQSDSSRTVAAGGHTGRAVLVVAQVAFAMVLLAGAGLMVRTLQNLQQADTGLHPEGVLTAYVGPPRSEYPEVADRVALYRELLDRVETLPGVQLVAGGDPLPMSGRDTQWTLSGEGFPRIDENGLRVDVANVTPDYFEAMGIPLLAGRAFREGEPTEAPPVIVDERLAEFLWPDAEALGRQVRFRGHDSPWLTVVGVVGHVKNYGVRAESRYELYMPYEANVWGLSLVVKTAGEPTSLVASIRAELAEIDPDLPLTRVETMASYYRDTIARETLAARTLAGFGGAGLLVAVLGLYGVIAYSVTLRTREIGVRMALGARSGTVLATVVREGLVLAAVGVALGLALSVWLGRSLESLLYEVRPADPTVLGPVAVGVLLVATLSSLVPARKATRIDPGIALRAD